MQFDDTLIYQRSLELIEVTRRVLRQLPQGFGFLTEQLRKASSSILLNFVEGYGRRIQRDQRHFFDIARGSANEVAAILDVAAGLGGIDQETQLKGRELCDHIARMLTRFRR